MIGTKPTPAPQFFFKTDDSDAILLSKIKSKEFHHITAKSSENEDVQIYN